MSEAGDLSLMDLFREEVRSHAATLNQGLLDLENDPANPRKIEPLMRAAHSIKGAARIVNIDAAVQLAHVMEDALVAAQEGRIGIGSADIDVFLRGTDLLARLGQAEEEPAAWSASNADLLADLKERVRRIAQGRPAPLTVAPPPPPPPVAPTTTRPQIVIPREPFVLGADYSMTELFCEEVRAATVALSDGVALLERGPADVATVEPLVQAARSLTGAARIVCAEPVIRLGQVVEELLLAVKDGRHVFVTRDGDWLMDALAILAALIPIGEEDLPPWLEKHAAAMTGLCERRPTLVRQSLAAPPMPVSPSPPPPPPPPSTLAVAPPAEEKATAEAVVRVTALSLNRLMGLAGESLVQARWLDPFATALLKLKTQQDHLAAALDSLNKLKMLVANLTELNRL